MDKMISTQIRDAVDEDVDTIAKLYIKFVHSHFKRTLPDEELAMWKYENEKQNLMNQITLFFIKVSGSLCCPRPRRYALKKRRQ